MLSKMRSRNITYTWNYFVKQFHQENNNLTSQLYWQCVDGHTWVVTASGHVTKFWQRSYSNWTWNLGLKFKGTIVSSPRVFALKRIWWSWMIDWVQIVDDPGLGSRHCGPRGHGFTWSRLHTRPITQRKKNTVTKSVIRHRNDLRINIILTHSGCLGHRCCQSLFANIL